MSSANITRQSCTVSYIDVAISACLPCSEFDLNMSEVFKVDALDLVERAEERMQMTDSVAGE